MDAAQADGAQPSGAGRIVALDVLRGFAVLGIVVPNIIAFGQPLDASFAPSFFLTDPGPGSEALWLAQFILIDGKMRGLFALLFGAGIALFCDRSALRGRGLLFQARRLAILALFGLLHGTLLWGGDILLPYAIIGFGVLPLLSLSPLRLAVMGGVTGVFGAAFYAATLLPLAMAAAAPPGDPGITAELRADLAAEESYAIEDAEVETALIRDGKYGAFVAHNWFNHAQTPFSDALYAAFELFPLMLIGAALYRGGYLSGRTPSPPVRRAAVIAILSGALLTAVIGLDALRQGLTFWSTWAAFGAWVTLPQLLMVTGLAILGAPLAGRASGLAARLLEGAGKTAFTNYLGTSLVMLFLFHGFGLGLFGKLNRWQLDALVPLVWLVMLGWPQWWLGKFRHGPLEWLWRCLTYGRLLPLRR